MFTEKTYELQCKICGKTVVFTLDDDGFFYCSFCNSRAEDIMQTYIDPSDLRRDYPAIGRRDDPVITREDVVDGVGPTESKSDFGSSKKNMISHIDDTVQPSMRASAKQVELDEGDDDHVPREGTIMKSCAKTRKKHKVHEGDDDHVPREGTIMKSCAKRTKKHKAQK